MTDPGDAERTIAHLFQRSGIHAQSENQLANALSLDLKWFNPSAARNVVAALAREGYLRRNDDGELAPAFDIRTIPVPLAYRPPPDLASKVTPRQETPPAGGAPENPPPTPEARPREPVTTEPPARPAADLGALLAGLSSKTGEEVGMWVQRLDNVIQRSDDALVPEVALLLAAAAEGVDVSAWLPAARERLVR